MDVNVKSMITGQTNIQSEHIELSKNDFIIITNEEGVLVHADDKLKELLHELSSSSIQARPISRLDQIFASSDVLISKLKSDSKIEITEQYNLLKWGSFFIKWTFLYCSEHNIITGFGNKLGHKKRASLAENYDHNMGWLMEKLQLLNLPAFHCSSDGNIIEANDSFTKIVGLKSERLKGENWSTTLLNSKDQGRLYILEKGARKQGLHDFQVELTNNLFITEQYLVSSFIYKNELTNDVEEMFVFKSNSAQRKEIEKVQRLNGKLIEMKSRISSFELNASRSQASLIAAQLNPHFTYNVFNSLQYFVLNEKIDTTLNFLASASNLVRSVMKNSECNLVTLSDELEVVNSYLKIEKTRHDDNFSYSINADRVEAEGMFVPPSMLYKIVQIAFIKGIELMKDEGFITVDFALNKKNNEVVCEIFDNSQGINAGNARLDLTVGKAFGTYEDIINKALVIYNSLELGDFSFETKNIKNNFGEVVGTKSTLKFPYIDKK